MAPGMKKQKKSNNIESKNKGENKMISVKSFKAFDAEKYGDPWMNGKRNRSQLLRQLQSLQLLRL